MFTRMLACFVLFTALSSSASAATCAQLLTAGQSYEDVHSGPSLTWTGDMFIEATYVCGSKTCFKGSMSFDNYSGGENLVTGEMEGSTLVMRRFVEDGKYTQTWKGTCKSTRVTGSWVNDSYTTDTGSFSIWY